MPFSYLRRAFLAVGITVSLVTAPAIAHAQPGSIAVSSHVSLEAKKVRTFSKSPKPTIAGSLSVGSVLRVDKGIWKPKPSFTYRWKADGITVAGATQSRYTVRAKDAGSRITVIVRAKKSGYRTAERTSPAVQISMPIAPAPVSSPAPAPVSPPSAAPAPVATSNPVPPARTVAIAGDGDYRVGVNVLAGTYLTTGATTGCYWERVNSFNGDFSSIIANDFGTGPRIVTIKPTDFGISFSGCGSWIREANAPFVSTITTGQYLVGAQIAPGLYSTFASQSGCYWETVSDFDGSSSSILANDYKSQAGTVYVQIASSVRGFASSGCGSWTRISS